MPADATAQQLDDLFQATKRALAAAGPRLVVTAAGEANSFDLSLEWTRAPRWPNATVEIRAWPITQQAERAQTLGKSDRVFPTVIRGSNPAYGLLHHRAESVKRRAKSVFVMNLPLHGAPEDRQDRVVRSLIENRDQLLRYILFLLASGDEAAASSGDLRRLLKSREDGPDQVRRIPICWKRCCGPCIAIPRNSSAWHRLLEVLRKAPGSSELLSDDFQKVWEPIWDAAQQAVAK